ncbi:PHP domain-containing protein [Balneolales bacterium ANBcel1]|nr:PHP domain-containing protein [Balneolales bacterium ANBcel1]
MPRADLHIHTIRSDGKLTPAQIVAQAVERKLDVIAITDHDTDSGVKEARQAAREEELCVVRGAEVSTLFEDSECHLLAYAFEDESVMQQLFADQKKRRISRARRIIEKLNRLGFDISFDEVLGEAGRASIGRPHIARVMISKGYAANTQEAFFRYLGNQASAYHKIDYPEIVDAIEMVHQSGGLAVLAHPGNHYNFLQLKQLKEYGMDGIECYHPSHNSAHQRRYLEYCNTTGLMATGGSDFHGSVADYYHLGVVYCTLEPDSPLLNGQEARQSETTQTYPEIICK